MARFRLTNFHDDKPHIKVGRTMEGNIFELVTVTLIIVMWVIALVVWNRSPESVPTHFSIDGTPDAYGSRSALLIIPVVGTLVSLLLLVGAYFPTRFVRLPVEVRTPGQCLLVVRMVRIMAVIAVPLFISIILMTTWPESKVPFGCMVGWLVLLIAVSVYYTVKIYQRRS